MRKQRNAGNRRIIFQLFLIVCLAIFFVFYIIPEIRYSKINKTITTEAGTIPEATVFLKNMAGEAQYVTDISTINVNKPGVYDLKIKYNNKVYKVKLDVKDTTPPQAVTKAVDLYESRPVSPQEFIESINDATDVTVSFKTEPDLNRVGNQEVTILLEDTSGNRLECKANLRISKAKEAVVDILDFENLSVKDFLKDQKDINNARIVELPSKPNRIGTYPAKVSINDVVYDTSIQVIDTVAPKAKTVDKEIWLNDKIEAEEFVTDIEDASNVKVSFKKEPDFTYVGNQTVSLILTDEGNNQTELEAGLTIVRDTEPPKIYGAKNTTIYIGSPISYKKGVYAFDNRDGEISFTVDSSNVNPKVVGTYKVIYTATDSSGNTSTKEIECNVKEMTVTMEELNKLADEILAEITTEDMTLREKAWEIYQYINTRITYTGVSDKTDWMKEAYSGIVNGVGDCFTYFAMSELFLNRIGIQTMRVERLRKPGETRHYWHLVNYGEGWYHFDACIHIPKLVSFMLTDAEIDAFSKRVGKDNYYYRFDRENYPRTPEK